LWLKKKLAEVRRLFIFHFSSDSAPWSIPSAPPSPQAFWCVARDVLVAGILALAFIARYGIVLFQICFPFCLWTTELAMISNLADMGEEMVGLSILTEP
jgi:hypothetical protein